MVKAVIFDIDGVLIDSLAANLKFYQNLFIAAGYKSPATQTLQYLFHLTMEGVIGEIVGKNQEAEIKRIWKMGYDRIVRYPDELLTTPLGLKETVAELAAKYKLGIVTSRIRNGVFTLPQLVAFKKYFPVAICFEDTQKHKPDPEPLLLACEKLAVKPAEAVYIGDTEADIIAAKAAGMKIVVFPDSKIPGADASTANFRDIPGLVALL